MAFIDLPGEIVMELAGFLGTTRDINSLSRVNRRTFSILNSLLYRYNIRNKRSSALFWAAENNRISTIHRITQFGADVNVGRGSLPGMSGSNLTALHVAAWKGHLAVVKTLLDLGADPEAQVLEGFTALYFALTGRHVKVARTISRRIRNLQTCFVDHRKLLTPLHLSAYLGLTDCVRFFLSARLDVNARDYKSMTPLYHALVRDTWCNTLIPQFQAIAKAKPVEALPLTSDHLLEIAETLLEFDANPDIEVPPSSSGLQPTTARQCGLQHWSVAIRALFNDNDNDQDKCHASNDIQIGRPWMSALFKEMQIEDDESTRINGEESVNDLIDHLDIRVDTGPAFQFDSPSFPSLSLDQALASNPKKPATTGSWSRSRPYSEQFPLLHGQSSNASSKSKAGPARTYSDKAKNFEATRRPLSIAETNMSESSQSEKRHGKAGKKSQWQRVRI